VLIVVQISLPLQAQACTTTDKKLEVLIMPGRIEDYAMIGDCHSAALVGRDGSVDWLCLPRFDSPACLCALLGTPENGRWQIAPAGEVRNTRRRYHDGTLILETEFECDDGVAAVIDFMPPRTGAPDLVRLVEGRRGQVSMRMDLTIRFDYGSVVPWVRHTERGIRATAGPEALYLRTPVPVHGRNMHTEAQFTIGAGQRIPFELVWASTFGEAPAERDVERSLRETEEFWRQWSGRCQYQGPWREAVLRSLITLKALIYAPTGGMVAAPTTSLPEHIGGVRNWDYRYCWLRDATLVLQTLLTGGYSEEAQAWREWLVHAVAGSPDRLQIMYGLAGERRLQESELEWLGGYEGSLPVRVGNGAWSQHQLDVYGQLMDTLHIARREGLPESDDAWRVQSAVMDFLEADWRRPDNGIWEVRGEGRQFTHSKVMAWVAMDRGIRAVEDFGLEGDAEKWRRIRDEIHAEVCREGFNPAVGSFVQYYGSDVPDASLLMLPLAGFLPARDRRMLGTVEYIQRRLVRDGLVDRYPAVPEVDRLPPGEGAFIICTCWLAENLHYQGRRQEARAVFERVLELRNDVGLLSEQFDPDRQRLVGNFPQAFSHLALVDTARTLSRPDPAPEAAA
jgi:GH15 family glucan-1,4-alpha-glucosidase